MQYNERGVLVETVQLEAPFPPFLYSWSPCGTRLAMLSNWHLRRCAVFYEHIHERSTL